MKSGPIPVCTGRAISPYIDLLSEIGAPVDRWIESCRLPVFLFEDLDTHIPMLNKWHLISLAEKNEGIDDFALRIAQKKIYQTLGPRLVTSVASAPTLLQGVEELGRCMQWEYSGMKVGVLHGPKDKVEFTFEKSFGIETPGFTQTEWMGVETLIKTVQLFAGSTWQPDTVSMRSSRDVPPLARKLYPETRFFTKQMRSFISFSKGLLSSSPCSYATTVLARLGTPAGDLEPPQAPASFSVSLERILASYLRDGYPSIDAIAEIAQVSPRTLQRRLKQESVTYKKLIDRARFKVAAKLLTKTDASSLEVALETGYEDPSHFARAFRRMAGCSPREYRIQRVST